MAKLIIGLSEHEGMLAAVRQDEGSAGRVDLGIPHGVWVKGKFEVVGDAVEYEFSGPNGMVARGGFNGGGFRARRDIDPEMLRTPVENVIRDLRTIADKPVIEPSDRVMIRFVADFFEHITTKVVVR